MLSYNKSALSYEEERQIAFDLEDKHGIFNKFWSMTRPRFTVSIPTAAVGFDKLGNCIQFMINPEFWAQLTLEQKMFVICHECLHIMLSHKYRRKGVPKTHKKLANVAMDLVVNHMLIDRFGFDRSTCEPTQIKVKDKEGKEHPLQYWFLDRVQGKDGKQLPLLQDKSFEYYYAELSKIAEEMGDSDAFDDHGDLESFDSKEFADRLGRELQDMNPDEVKDLKEWLEKQFEQDGKKEGGQQAGNNEGNILTHVKIEKPVYKKKWESVIKNWVRRALTFVEVEQWARKSRRLTNINTDFMLPSDMETEETDKEKLDVWFFQDTSGSCSHLAERFFKAARSIPPNKFNVKLHCFDTRVYPMSDKDVKEGKLYGFGGTTFTCIEDYIKYRVANGEKFPSAIFCITDGFGDKVNCTNPKQWHWFLSADMKDCIPPECKMFKLEDYE